MKTTFKTITFMLLATSLMWVQAMLFTGCSDDDEKNEPNIGTNEFTFDEKTYPIVSVGMEEEGEGEYWIVLSPSKTINYYSYGGGDRYVDIVIYQDDFGKPLELKEGTPNDWYVGYTEPFGDDDDLYLSGNRSDMNRIDSGTITVIKEGNHFTVSFDVTFKDWDDRFWRLKGNYSGTPKEMRDVIIGF